MKKILSGIILLVIAVFVGIFVHGQLKQPVTSNSSHSSTSNPNPQSIDEPTDLKYRKKVEQLLGSMNLEEKVGQMFYARVPQGQAVAAMKQYKFGGYIMFANDFEGQTVETVSQNVKSYQEAASIHAFIGVDEEGGTVNRVSSYPAFRATPFLDPGTLYETGGWDLIKSDTKEKDQLLKSLGINTNFAPVADIPEQAGDFIWDRAISPDPTIVSQYVKLTVDQMNEDKIASVVKHFPGYGNNVDTHTGIATDNRSLSSFETKDFKPFETAIKENAPFILVAHNIIQQIDSSMPASLSAPIHDILREKLNYQGIIITDDLSMDAITSYTGAGNAAVQAVLAGNDMLTVDDYADQIPAVIEAVKTGKIKESRIDDSVRRILSAKFELGLI